MFVFGSKVFLFEISRIVFTVFLLVLCLNGSSSYAATKISELQPATLSDNYKKGFLEEIQKILIFAATDKIQIGFGQEGIVDVNIAGRRKYFDDTTWIKYKSFAESYSDFLRQKVGKDVHTMFFSYCCKGNPEIFFMPASSEKQIVLLGKGIHQYAAGDVVFAGADRTYTLKLTFIPHDLSDPQNFTIVDWEINLDEYPRKNTGEAK